MNQNDHILKHLKRHKTITPLEALHLYGCFRLSGRILELRQAGHNILTSIVENNGKHFAEYRLVKAAKGAV